MSATLNHKLTLVRVRPETDLPDQPGAFGLRWKLRLGGRRQRQQEPPFRKQVPNTAARPEAVIASGLAPRLPAALGAWVWRSCACRLRQAQLNGSDAESQQKRQQTQLAYPGHSLLHSYRSSIMRLGCVINMSKSSVPGSSTRSGGGYSRRLPNRNFRLASSATCKNQVQNGRRPLRAV